jgi:hypothetical protein
VKTSPGWQEVSAEVNFDAWEVILPTYHGHRGFLQEEIHNYHTHPVKGMVCAECAAYFRTGLRYFSGVYLTNNEFGKLDLPLFPRANAPKASTKHTHQVCILFAIQPGPLG